MKVLSVILFIIGLLGFRKIDFMAKVASAGNWGGALATLVSYVIFWWLLAWLFLHLSKSDATKNKFDFVFKFLCKLFFILEFFIFTHMIFKVLLYFKVIEFYGVYTRNIILGICIFFTILFSIYIFMGNKKTLFIIGIIIKPFSLYAIYSVLTFLLKFYTQTDKIITQIIIISIIFIMFLINQVVLYKDMKQSQQNYKLDHSIYE